jgi:haloacetate dehalogenase
MLRFPHFQEHTVDTGEVRLRTQIGGSGPPLLLLHGHPQTQAMWHRVVAPLAERFTVVAMDLRGYGDSSAPTHTPDHAAMSKRAMARDAVAVMHHLGCERFRVLAHDRGARVAHRLAVDHAERIERLVLLDIAPTLAMYEQTSMAFATAYFHWFFLIQPAPLPETLISADPDFYLQRVMGGRHAGLGAFAPEALAEYLRCARNPDTVHAICEDYRAAATIDLEHDRADHDAGVKLACPLLVLWGAHGVIQRCFDPMAEWRRVAADVRGHALPCGHYIAEEAPQALLDAALPFLAN